MSRFLFSKFSQTKQFLISALAVCLLAAVCFSLSSILDYKIVAFLLLVTVSIIAMFFEIKPVLLAALLSALVWDFFFIPPKFTFHVGNEEDTILLLMYFLIALLNGALTYKIREFKKIALKREEKANILKLYNTLFNSLSHELRTPIATIIGATDNLQAANSKLTAENRSELLAEISKASFRLHEQVENLLNMSRLESGFLQPKKDWLDITEMLYGLVKKIEENGAEQNFYINISPSIPLFKTDKGMLEQIVYNLLNNAKLYTEPGAEIFILAECVSDALQIIVEDNGKGFPEDEIKNVFNKFYRLKNTGSKGTGLGLSIVKGFTTALGGTIQLENIPAGGAKFTLEIPAETSYLKNLNNE